VIIDMNYDRDTTSGEEGLALLDTLHSRYPDTAVIAMTGWSSIDLAVESIRRGAADFIPKPWENGRVLDAIQDAIHHRKHQRSSEMAVARRVQRRLLPNARGTAPGVHYDCAFRPAGDLGGDLWNVFPSAGGTAFVLGDISGKGTGAALMMATLQATIRGNEDIAGEPARLAKRANSLFFQSTAPEHFATVFFGHYDPHSRVIRYVNCGHPAPVLLRGENIHRLDATSVVLGAFEHATIIETMITAQQNDRVILFSDGVSESPSPADITSEDDGWIGICAQRFAKANHVSLAECIAAAAISDDDVTVLELRFT
jgi:sigma-B regulation protein RsbU (phosphoserine phosphatase)